MPQPPSPDATPISSALLREWPVPADDRGTAFVLGGARTVPGAVLLTGTAALRAGAGTLQLGASERHAVALGVAVPESSVFGLPETAGGAISRDAADVLADVLPQARAVVIGPGLTDADETFALLERVLPLVSADARLVLDAFALGALSRQPALVKSWAGHVVLSPNHVEAAFLLDRAKEEIDDYERAAAEIADRYQAVVTLMGAIATPAGDLWVDGGGHIGLATSGSGDVLAGLIGGFLARAADPAQAACWATHVHAMAGQRLIPRTGLTGLLARDLVGEVGAVISELTA
ncbi:NAD(P)H-hydrate dehydratase [Amycolatopsis acidiphila]|uniref:ADP-dependent (S)-NAD(P)H-hydrate dehydratase n=1 Tax=Amycolatopsis acidiphila TaxID=715473 RepID=A0A557ZWE7_9PSEU|nr:NAD(P)H-hydrate dehydratase [Amycolatopsis acidiphila]TVT16333.1 NAD(P)H-hydrate dehydratase [Amycolatopsis acidiphila]UIJ61216.1 NAD(P)H-hydrate dehydratase [Amycolatopsis acidiphila]GHG97755.1 ADP-dependent (S)-NAD(P)H-hydrate dehydratase [Amycolatopsis acidiphila]